MTFEKALRIVQAARADKGIYSAELRQAVGVVSSQRPEDYPPKRRVTADEGGRQ
jgi:hypothetical protein